MALTTRERIPLRIGGWSSDCSLLLLLLDDLWEYLIGSNVTTPPDCAPLIMVTLTYIIWLYIYIWLVLYRQCRIIVSYYCVLFMTLFQDKRVRDTETNVSIQHLLSI